MRTRKCCDTLTVFSHTVFLREENEAQEGRMVGPGPSPSQASALKQQEERQGGKGGGKERYKE